MNRAECIGFIRKYGMNGDPSALSEMERDCYKEVQKSLHLYGYDVERKSDAMKAVTLLQSMEFGTGQVVDLYKEAVRHIWDKKEGRFICCSGLTQVDSTCFEKPLISAIYDFLIGECRQAVKTGSGLFFSPNGWWAGKLSEIRKQTDKLIREKQDALELVHH